MAGTAGDQPSAERSKDRRSEKLLFLSREWFEQVVAAVEDAKRADPYFRGLVTGISLKVAYVVTDLPPNLDDSHSGSNQMVIHVVFRRGQVDQVRWTDQLGSEPTDLAVTAKYRVAARLFRGEIGAVSTLLGGRVKAKPVNGFRGWSKVSANSLVAATKVLKAARKVPTAFPPSPRKAEAGRRAE